MISKANKKRVIFVRGKRATNILSAVLLSKVLLDITGYSERDSELGLRAPYMICKTFFGSVQAMTHGAWLIHLSLKDHVLQ